MALKHSLQAAAVRESLRYVGRNPGENIGKLVNLLKPFARVPEHRNRCRVEEVWQDPENNWRRMTKGLCPIVTGSYGEVCHQFLAQCGAHWRAKAAGNGRRAAVQCPLGHLDGSHLRLQLALQGCWAEEYERGGHLSLEELVVSSHKARNWGYTSTCTQVATPPPCR